MNAVSRTASAGTPAYDISVRFSATVRLGKTERPSGTVHSPSRASSSGPAPRTLTPPRWTSPEVGDFCPETTLISVDLPAPLGPSSAITAPLGTDRSTPRSTSMRP